jgi:hypothetical protein
MKNQKVSTTLGIIVIVIFAIATGVFVWRIVKNRQVVDQPQQVVNVRKTLDTQTPGINQGDQVKTQETTSSNKPSSTAVVIQPKMPTSSDETNKSPQQLTKDFYNWYIGNTNYLTYQTEQLKETKNPVIPSKLVLKSPFISSTYEQNMYKTTGGDSILCSQEPDNNIFLGNEDPVISGNTAKMYINIGYSSSPEINIKIQVMLKKEKEQWKIDEINCSQFHL